MVDVIVETVVSLMGGLSEGFATVVQNISNMFWTPGVEGAAGSPTILTIFALVSLALSIIFWLVNLVRSFIRSRSR